MTRIEVPNSARNRRSGNRFGRWLFILVLLLAVGGGLWTWLTIGWAYAEGERAGVLQNFVRRGFLCKTYEGEIALYYGGGQYLGPGGSPQLWHFSVRDKAVAEKLNKAVGSRVRLSYTEHPGVPTSCFAETRYYVDKVTEVTGEPGQPAATAPGAASTPGPAPAGSAAPAPNAAMSDPASAAR
jgi:hypothetical protein